MSLSISLAKPVFYDGTEVYGTVYLKPGKNDVVSGLTGKVPSNLVSLSVQSPWNLQSLKRLALSSQKPSMFRKMRFWQHVEPLISRFHSSWNKLKCCKQLTIWLGRLLIPGTLASTFLVGFHLQWSWRVATLTLSIPSSRKLTSKKRRKGRRS